MMETLKVRLNERGIHVGLSSAKMTQTERATVLREFKCNKHFLMMISSNSHQFQRSTSAHAILFPINSCRSIW